jgi:hypothetical protein
MTQIPNTPNRTPSIAIVGTEGSGKTVLIATLAKRLSTVNSQGVFLNPQGVVTLKYIEKIWQTLQQGDWPPSTPPGQLFDLRWNLEITGNKITGDMKSDVRLVDAPGQDLRLLFGEEKFGDIQSLPQRLKQLAEYCHNTDIVLFLIDLGAFIGEGNSQQRTDNEAAIKSAMDFLSADGGLKRFCIVFTQFDLYEGLAKSRGGWAPLAKEAIPYIYSAYLRKKVPVFFVSAVNKTVPDLDSSGNPRRLPAPGFGSTGFGRLVDWITTQVREVSALLLAQSTRPSYRTTSVAQEEPDPQAFKVHQQPISQKPAPLSQGNTAQPLSDPWWATLTWWKKWSWVWVPMIVFLWFRSCMPSSPQPYRPTQPVPVLVEKRSTDYSFIFDDWVTVTGAVQNNGASGQVVVEAYVTENDREVDRKRQTFYLLNGETKRFEIKLDGIYAIKNPHATYVYAK